MAYLPTPRSGKGDYTHIIVLIEEIGQLVGAAQLDKDHGGRGQKREKMMMRRTV